MTKRETLKWTLQIIASVITAVLTALGTTSCMGIQTKQDVLFRRPVFFYVTNSTSPNLGRLNNYIILRLELSHIENVCEGEVRMLKEIMKLANQM